MRGPRAQHQQATLAWILTFFAPEHGVFCASFFIFCFAPLRKHQEFTYQGLTKAEASRVVHDGVLRLNIKAYRGMEVRFESRAHRVLTDGPGVFCPPPVLRSSAPFRVLRALR